MPASVFPTVGKRYAARLELVHSEEADGLDQQVDDDDLVDKESNGDKVRVK